MLSPFKNLWFFSCALACAKRKKRKPSAKKPSVFEQARTGLRFSLLQNP
jgi:hypothetical protein